MQSIISQTLYSCIHISGRPGRILTMLCTSFKPHNTSQIGFIVSDYTVYSFFNTMSDVFRVCKINHLSDSTVLSKSPGGPGGFPPCYTHILQVSLHCSDTL